jgi:hypothetical protein
MGFWDTFVKVWQVRTSVKIQEGIEDFFEQSKKRSELESNIPKITSEVIKKNEEWDEKLNYHRNKSK